MIKISSSFFFNLVLFFLLFLIFYCKIPPCFIFIHKENYRLKNKSIFISHKHVILFINLKTTYYAILPSLLYSPNLLLYSTVPLDSLKRQYYYLKLFYGHWDVLYWTSFKVVINYLFLIFKNVLQKLLAFRYK